MPSPKLSHSIAAKALLAIAAVLIVVQAWDYINFTVDDVFIPIRYAQNASHGNGLVYNLGENVEGYSDPVWVFALAGIAHVSDSTNVLLWSAKSMSFVFGIFTLLLLYKFSKRLFAHSSNSDLYASFSILACAMCAPFIAWSVAGLETTLLAFLYLAIAFAIFGLFESVKVHKRVSILRYVILMLAALLGTLTRPEPVMLIAILFGVIAFRLPSLERKRFLVWTVVPYLIAFGAFLGWRWMTYHALVPNTFYAKTGGGISGTVNGVKYVCASLAFVAAPLLVLIPFAFRSNRRRDPLLLWLTLIIAFDCFFAVFARGDWMPGARFIVPVAPILILLGISGLQFVLESIFGSDLRTLSSKVLISSGLFIAVLFAMSGRTALRGESGGFVSGFASIHGHSFFGHEEAGAWLASHVREGSTVALSEAGLISTMIPSTRILDLGGLMDPHIARDRRANANFDVRYVLDAKPDFIVLHIAPLSALLATAASDPHRALVSDTAFQSGYSLAHQSAEFLIYCRKN